MSKVSNVPHTAFNRAAPARPTGENHLGWSGVLYRTPQGSLPLPRWAEAFLGLGQDVIQQTNRATIGISVPARSRVSLLIGAGAVSAHIRSGSTLDDSNNYFEALAGLEAGTSLTWVKGGYVRPALFDGVGENPIDGRRYLRLQVQDSRWGGLIESCYPQDCLSVQIREEEVQLPKGVVHGKSLNINLDFLEPIIQVPSLESELLKSNPDVVLVGKRNWFFEEASIDRLLIETTRGIASGTLGDVLRPYQGSGVQPFRSVFVPHSSVKDWHKDLTPPLIIFDGAQAFMDTRHLWPDSTWVVVLDRSEPASTDAAFQLNQLFIDRKGEVDMDYAMPGVEVMSFVRSRS